MKNDDLIDALISKQLQKCRRKESLPKTKCPPEDIIHEFVMGKHTKNDAELIKHFLACTECKQTLIALMDIEAAQKELQDVPAHLLKNARDLLHKPLTERAHAKIKTLPKKITLIWDKATDTITHLLEELEEVVAFQEVVPQPSRNHEQPEKKKVPAESFHDFPHQIQVKTALGALLLEITHADREGYLTLTVSSLAPKKISSGMEARLYKGKILCGALPFADGKALFPRLKQGTYHLAFFDEGRRLESIHLPILVK